MKLGIIANLDKSGTGAALVRLVNKARQRNLELLGHADNLPEITGIERMPPGELVEQADVLVTLGGDGTVIRAVQILDGRDIPVLGVNLGSLGFMTSAAEEDLERAIDCLASGDYEVTHRTLAKGSLICRDEIVGEYRVLNDFAIGWGASASIVTIELLIDNEPVATYDCDGLIVSTTTGSTGHSLSAGGPILHPDTCAFVINPICPHTLSNRPLVVADSCCLEVRVVRTSKGVLFVADGGDNRVMKQGDCLKIRKSAESAHLILLPGHSYFDLLRSKLHWRGSSL